jgi:tetratricopeptide (TPR) repeat protein
LSSLVSKSLLRRAPGGRFDLHEVIRQYAGGYLRDDLTLRNRHSEYYLNLLHQSEDALFGVDEANRLRELFNEFGNLRIAWEQAIKQKMYALIDSAMDTYWTVYAVHGWFQEGIEQTSALVESLRADAHTREEKIYLCNAMMSCAAFTARSGKHAQARSVYEQCIETLRGLGETKRLPQALVVYGKVISMMGDFSTARSALDEGVEIATQNNDVWFMGLGQINQGFNAAQEGNLEYAYERMQSGLALWRTLGNMSAVSFALNHLSPIAMHLGKLDDADAYLQESLALSLEIHDRWGIGSTYGQLGNLALRRGDFAAAKESLERSLGIFENLGLRWEITGALTQLGKVAIASEDWTEAEQLLKRAVKTSLEAQIIPQAIDAALELADCFAHQGKVSAAMELILAAMGHPACTESARQRAMELKSLTEPRISLSQFAESAGEVEAAPFEEILARSLT